MNTEQTITVTISLATLNSFNQEVLAGQFVLNRLREAGIPVDGILWLRAPSYGVLTMTQKLSTDELIYTWTGPAQQDDIASFFDDMGDLFAGA